MTYKIKSYNGKKNLNLLRKIKLKLQPWYIIFKIGKMVYRP